MATRTPPWNSGSKAKKLATVLLVPSSTLTARGPRRSAPPLHPTKERKREHGRVPQTWESLTRITQRGGKGYGSGCFFRGRSVSTALRRASDEDRSPPVVQAERRRCAAPAFQTRTTEKRGRESAKSAVGRREKCRRKWFQGE